MNLLFFGYNTFPLHLNLFAGKHDIYYFNLPFLGLELLAAV